MSGISARTLEQLQHGQIEWMPGPLERQARENHDLLMSLNEDSMLRPFRVRAGHPAPGIDMGGWYDAEGFAPGANFGQWICALSRFYAMTGDTPTRDKVHRLVAAYKATIEPDGRFYRHNRFPAYIYDKLTGGLIDAMRFTQAEDAKAALTFTTQAVLPYLPAHAVARNEHSQPGEDFTLHAWDESYTLPETQFHAWHLTGNEVHRTLARRFLYDDFFSALGAGHNVLPGKHAYSHMNALSSAAQAYLSLNSSMHLDAARHGFAMIEAQSFATGGWGPDEHFIEPGSGALGASLVDCKMSFETPCGAYAHFKLTRYLLRITRDARYGDSMERVLYNTVLGASPLKSDGSTFYYSDYSQDARKTSHWDRWPCCAGSLPLLAADYAISLCFADPLGLYVNLYAPAQVTWQQAGIACRLKITTDYPYDSVVSMTLVLPTSLRFALRLRIPAWTLDANLYINGQHHSANCMPGTFATIDREWRTGDQVDLDMSMPLRLRGVDAQHPQKFALLAGPLVLMRILDTSDSDTAITTQELLSAHRFFRDARDWQVQASGGPLTFRPFMDINDERYRVYQDVVGSGSGS